MPDTLSTPAPRKREAGEAVVEVAFPASLGMLTCLRGFLVGVLMEHGFDGDFAMDLQMAADEAVTNVIEHAYGFDSSRTVNLRLAIRADQVALLLKDSGKAFESPELKPLDLASHIRSGRTGGLGRYMMFSVMDSVVYDRRGEGNSLLMVKKKAAL